MILFLQWQRGQSLLIDSSVGTTWTGIEISCRLCLEVNNGLLAVQTREVGIYSP